MTQEDFSKIFIALERTTSALQVSQLLAELQTVIERISFSRLHLTLRDQHKVLFAELDLLFEDQISKEMHAFVRWLAKNEFLAIVADNTGMIFFNVVAKKYRALKEVHFISAAVLSLDMQNLLRRLLHRNYDARTTRVVFKVAPALIAGFVIQDGVRIVDKSLRSFAITSINQRLNSPTSTVIGGVHG